MISDGLQMSHSSATDKNAQSGIDTISLGEFLPSVFYKEGTILAVLTSWSV